MSRVKRRGKEAACLRHALVKTHFPEAHTAQGAKHGRRQRQDHAVSMGTSPRAGHTLKALCFLGHQNLEAPAERHPGEASPWLASLSCRAGGLSDAPGHSGAGRRLRRAGAAERDQGGRGPQVNQRIGVPSPEHTAVHKADRQDLCPRGVALKMTVETRQPRAEAG